MHGIGYMNYIETCTKIAFFLWRSSNYRPLKSVLHVRPGWIIYQNMRETWEKKVMKFETRNSNRSRCTAKKNHRGGLNQPPPPPNGIRVNSAPQLIIASSKSYKVLWHTSMYSVISNISLRWHHFTWQLRKQASSQIYFITYVTLHHKTNKKSHSRVSCYGQ